MVEKLVYPDFKDPNNFKLICFRALCYITLDKQFEQGYNKPYPLNEYSGMKLDDILQEHPKGKFCITAKNKSFLGIRIFFLTSYSVEIYLYHGLISLELENNKCKRAFFISYGDKDLTIKFCNWLY